MIKDYIKKQVYKHPTLVRMIINLLARCHNYCHHKIAELASILEGGFHPKHRITQYHKFFVDQVESDDSVLDVGCGIGLLSYKVAQKAKKVVGIDFSEKNINYARNHYQHSNLEFVLGDVTTYKFPGQFDKIILSNVLEHIDDRVNLLKVLRRISNTILFRVPMEDRDWLTVYKKECGLEYRLDITHRLEYRLETIEEELAAAGWKIDKHRVVWGEFWAILVKSDDQ
ncbi:MAG: hypothetical protein A2589_02215 [Candidatus Vogelbacteria bacterium RIFOXYD1_FULL_46_19]|uniref:Methyltransferase domain-containing protein n=1 Tax=Candidatus Vogelbacteria bacterium RIFOXYD1_FULL_46_19 TaxID=1802439 RepID=A0A1G2QGA1_9BACT|nr:MAG: hypothetical protein A2589_02215 [Candidatus Vogelbacteria bacterium RIFOXYD1_FULL_46_19]